LVGADEPGQYFGVQAAVGMGYVSAYHGIYPGVSLVPSFRQLGKVPIIGRRQVVPDFPELLVHYVEVVGQPLRRWSYASIREQGARNGPMRPMQRRPVLFHPAQQMEASPPGAPYLVPG